MKTTVKENNLCILCGEPRIPGRRYCRPCHLARKKKLSKDRKSRTQGDSICEICGAKIPLGRKTQKFCKDCESNTVQEYIPQSPIQIVESVLQRKLKPSEIIYYLDGNINNTNLNNLIILPDSSRDKLDKFIQIQKDIICQPHSLGTIYWDNLRMLLIVLWTRKKKRKFIKLWKV